MKNRSLLLVLIFMLIVCFTATSCGKDNKTTLYASETITSKGCAQASSMTKYDWLKTKLSPEGETITDYKAQMETLLDTYVLEDVIAKNDKSSVNDSYMVCELRLIAKKYKDYLNNNSLTYIYNDSEEEVSDLLAILNGTAGCLDVKNKQAVNKAIEEAFNGSEENVLRLSAMYIVEVTDRLGATESEPIMFKGGSFGNVMSHFWNNFFIFPIGWLLFTVSKLLGGFYWIGLILVTLLIRTLGWPIYAKSNDMSNKMSQMQPELTKIQEKYATKKDPESQRQMQMEQAMLYKKYKVGPGGCLAPFLQFPIFIAIYRAISRMPYTKLINGSEVGSTYMCKNNWAAIMNSNFFGVDLFADKTGGGVNQLVGIIILIILVVGTQILSNILTKVRQKKTFENSQKDIPAYRRQAYQQQQNNSQMNMMLYMMIFMMGIFVWSSKAGLGLYWLIGNVFSMGQMWINGIQQEKRVEKERNKNNIYTVKGK